MAEEARAKIRNFEQGMKVIGKAINYYGDDDALIMVSDQEEK